MLTESVLDAAVRPIRPGIDGGGPSSPSHRGWGNPSPSYWKFEGEAHLGASRVAG
jgi:hypothetical protein